MIIVLEGSDGTGKTTLARHLQEKLGAHYIHLTYRWPDKMDKYHVAALLHAISIIEKTDKPVILDRWWLSEAVYSKVFRGGSKWPQLGRSLERALLSRGGIYIMCLADDIGSYTTSFKKLRDSRNEMYADTTEVARVYNDIYHGVKTYPDSIKSYVDSIMYKQPMKYWPHVLRYSIEVEGQELSNFTRAVIQKLMVLQKGLRDYKGLSRVFSGNPLLSSNLVVTYDDISKIPWPMFNDDTYNSYMEMGSKSEYMHTIINVKYREGMQAFRKYSILERFSSKSVISVNKKAYETVAPYLGGNK